MVDYKVYRALLIIIVIVDILAFFGITSNFGYDLETILIASFMFKHFLAILNGYALYILLKRF